MRYPSLNLLKEQWAHIPKALDVRGGFIVLDLVVRFQFGLFLNLL